MQQLPIWIQFIVAVIAVVALVGAIIANARIGGVRETLAADRAGEVMQRIWSVRLGDLERYFATDPFQAANVSALLRQVEEDLEELLDDAPKSLRKEIIAAQSLIREYVWGNSEVSRDGLKDVVRGIQNLGRYLGGGGKHGP